jgi:predicted acetyltransferase
MQVEVERAPKGAKSALHNLMQLYFHDLSEFAPREVDSQGVFYYKYFDGYWGETDRYPFLIRVDGSLAGFAFVFFDGEGRANMAEFFVLRGKRRHGVGAMAAKKLFDTFQADWEVREEPLNFGAQRFWRGVIQEYTQGEFEELTLDDDEWRGPVQRFSSRHRIASSVDSAKEA